MCLMVKCHKDHYDVMRMYQSDKGRNRLGTRTEIKNINSFKFIEKAIEYEVKRQIAVLESEKKLNRKLGCMTV